MCVGPQYGTCFMSTYWRLEIWVDSYTFGQFVLPDLLLQETTERRTKWFIQMLQCPTDVWAGMAQSVQWLAKRRMIRGSNPGRGDIFRTGGAHPVSYTVGTGSFPGIKRPGRGVDHPPKLAPRLKKVCNCTSAPPLGLRGLFEGDLYLYLIVESCVFCRACMKTIFF